MYKGFVLSVLTLVYALNFLDRNLVIVLLQSIKVDLSLTDTQLGLLTGIAFGLFYSTLGFPLARWADRGNRVTITALSIGLWGLTVASCLFAKTFPQLIFARIMAAVGEAGCMPPTYSLLGDYFPKPKERIWAMTIYWLAGPLSALVGFTVGGYLGQIYGWRIAFLLIGIPGLLAAVLTKLTVSEPRLFDKARVRQENESAEPSLIRVALDLWCQPTSRNLNVGYILLVCMGLGLAPWYAAFMMRNHGMSTSQVGIALGWIFGAAGATGMLLGGYITERWFSENERTQINLIAISVVIVFPCFCLFLLVPQKLAALLALVPLVVTFSFCAGPTFALMQRLVPASVRARSAACMMLLANLIGMGVGPLIVGSLSDVMTPAFGNNSLRYAMLIISSIALWSAYHFWAAGRTIKSDLLLVSEKTSEFHAISATTP